MIKTVPLRDLVAITGGGTPDRAEPTYWGPGVPWATVKDLEGLELASTQESITPAGLEHSAASVVPAGSIIIATRMALGKAAINSVDVAINQDLKALTCASDVEPRYLLHFLAFRAPHIEAMGEGATVKGITIERLTELRVPLPSPDEQRRIAAMLDRADAVHWKRRESLRLLDGFLRSTYEHIAGPANPEGAEWPEYTVEDLAAPGPRSLRTGPFGSALRHSEFVSSGVAVLGIDNAVQNHFAWAERRYITAEKYAQLKRYTVGPGDVIVTIMGTTGRSSVVPHEIPLAITTKHLAAITVDRARVIPEFLSHALHSDRSVRAQIASANRGAIMAGLNLGIIRRLRLRVPPLETQRRFAEIVACVRAIKDRLVSASRDADVLSESLAQRAFNTVLG